MMKFKLFLISFCFTTCLLAQEPERAFRIRASQFPEASKAFLDKNTQDLKKIRYYCTVDTLYTYYSARIKKDRLWYWIDFNPDNNFKELSIFITEVDIPNESLEHVKEYLNQAYSDWKIKGLLQSYPSNSFDAEAEVVRSGFQNLIIPEVEYQFSIKGRNKEGNKINQIIRTDSQGRIMAIRNALPVNYDHVLY